MQANCSVVGGVIMAPAGTFMRPWCGEISFYSKSKLKISLARETTSSSAQVMDGTRAEKIPLVSSSRGKEIHQ